MEDCPGSWNNLLFTSFSGVFNSAFIILGMASSWTMCLLWSSIWSSSLFSLSSNLSFLDWDSLEFASRSSFNFISLLADLSLNQSIYPLPGTAIPGDYPPLRLPFSLPIVTENSIPRVSSVSHSDSVFQLGAVIGHQSASLQRTFQEPLIGPFLSQILFLVPAWIHSIERLHPTVLAWPGSEHPVWQSTAGDTGLVLE